MSLLELGIVAAVIYGVVLWLTLGFYVVRDARRRSPSLVFQLFALVFGLFPPLLGLVVYFIARPPLTMEEQQALELEELALRGTNEGDVKERPCPGCGRSVESDFVICPYCRTQFGRRCSTCHHILRLGWSICPYCAEEVGVLSVTRRTATN
jgi:RNA polymerase subunit RPABC4/transcription elongation factor Spt4